MPAQERIVCIEDDPEMIDLIKLILEKKGYEVIGVVGGPGAVEAVRGERPHLILLDLMMPEVDGWEVFRRIRDDEELGGIPIIVVTAKAQSIDRVLGLHIARADDYVTKPFGPRELLTSVEKVLASKK